MEQRQRHPLVGAIVGSEDGVTAAGSLGIERWRVRAMLTIIVLSHLCLMLCDGVNG